MSLVIVLILTTRAEIQIELFYDSVTTPPTTPGGTLARSSSGGFYSTETSAELTILRLKDGMDTSLPSTNAVAAWNLFRLGAMLDDARYTALAKETVAAFEAEMLQYPWLFPGLLAGVVASRLGVGGRNWVVAGDDKPQVTPEEEEAEREKEKERERGAKPAEKGKGKGKGSANGAVDLSEFFKALDVAPRGELRALVSVEGSGGRQEWVASRRGRVGEVAGKGGVFCCTESGLRRFTRGDLGDFTGQG